MVLNTDLDSLDMLTGLDFRERNNWNDFLLSWFHHLKPCIFTTYHYILWGGSKKEEDAERRQRNAFW